MQGLRENVFVNQRLRLRCGLLPKDRGHPKVISSEYSSPSSSYLKILKFLATNSDNFVLGKSRREKRPKVCSFAIRARKVGKL